MCRGVQLVQLHHLRDLDRMPIVGVLGVEPSFLTYVFCDGSKPVFWL